MVTAQPQRLRRGPELDTSVLVILEQFSAKLSQIVSFRTMIEFRQQTFAQLIINRPAIIRINQAEIPEFCATINVRIAGSGNHQQTLRQ